MADTVQQAPSAAPLATKTAGYRAVVRRLSSAQKTAHGAPAYSRYANRRLGRYLAAAAYRAGGHDAQVAFWGPEDPEASMLAQLAIVTAP